MPDGPAAAVTVEIAGEDREDAAIGLRNRAEDVQSMALAVKSNDLRTKWLADAARLRALAARIAPEGGDG